VERKKLKKKLKQLEEIKKNDLGCPTERHNGDCLGSKCIIYNYWLKKLGYEPPRCSVEDTDVAVIGIEKQLLIEEILK
jgi:hypothetical protein